MLDPPAVDPAAVDLGVPGGALLPLSMLPLPECTLEPLPMEEACCVADPKLLVTVPEEKVPVPLECVMLPESVCTALEVAPLPENLFDLELVIFVPVPVLDNESVLTTLVEAPL